MEKVVRVAPAILLHTPLEARAVQSLPGKSWIVSLTKLGWLAADAVSLSQRAHHATAISRRTANTAR